MSTRIKGVGRTTGGPELSLGFNHAGRGPWFTLCFNKPTNVTVETHTRIWRSSYVDFCPYLRSCHPSNVYAPVPSRTSKYKICLCTAAFVFSPILTYRSSSPHKTIPQSYSDLFLACSSRLTILILRCPVLSGLFKPPHAAFFFFVLEIPRSRYPVVALEWSGVSLTEYSLRMVSHLYSCSGTHWIS